jgi:hypothetical protein
VTHCITSTQIRIYSETNGHIDTRRDLLETILGGHPKPANEVTTDPEAAKPANEVTTDSGLPACLQPQAERRPVPASPTERPSNWDFRRAALPWPSGRTWFRSTASPAATTASSALSASGAGPRGPKPARWSSPHPAKRPRSNTALGRWSVTRRAASSAQVRTAQLAHENQRDLRGNSP